MSGENEKRAGDLAAIAARLGVRLCSIPSWSSEDRAKYRDQHGPREKHGYSVHDDIEIAAATRMLMRDELNHEALVCSARDRICALSLENSDLKAEVERLRQTVLCDHQKINEAHEEVDQLNRQIGLLISEIWNLAIKLGVANADVTPDGPQALLLMEDIGAEIDARSALHPTEQESGKTEGADQ